MGRAIHPSRNPGGVTGRALSRSSTTRQKSRRITYSTNAIESVNMSLRTVTKNRGSFPSDQAVLKLFYLALMNISQKWTMPLQNWKAALNRFTIMFEERMPIC